MESKVLRCTLLLVVGLAAALGAAPRFRDASGAPVEPAEIVSSMTTAALVGQTLMVGYEGGYPSDELLNFIRDAGLGGVKVFGWNSEDLVTMTEGIVAMQDTATDSRFGIPLFVATDQEGGWVRHVKGATTDTPGNLAIGSSGVPWDAYESALLIGRELAALGINMNFAPTVDVYTDPDADVIGPRAFSADPIDTALLSLAYFRGLERAGVIATAKHYPGHGNTDVDSHGTLPVIQDSFDTLLERDLVPYRVLIPEGLPAVMVGHLSFPLITESKVPATLSPILVERTLRGTLGFDGLTVTDDMRMYGVLQGGMQIPEACRLAILAGNDVVLISRDLETQLEVYDYLVESAERDKTLLKALTDSVTRIIETKARYLADPASPLVSPRPEEVPAAIPDREGSGALFDLACRSVAAVRPEGIPAAPELLADGGSKLLLVGRYSVFIREGLRRFPRAKSLKLGSYGASAAQIEQLKAMASEQEHVIFCLGGQPDLEALEQIEALHDKITVFSVLTPIYLRDLPWVRSALATFSRSAESCRAGFAVLCGDFEPEGRTPISVDPAVP